MSLDKVMEGYMKLHDNIDHLSELQITAKFYSQHTSNSDSNFRVHVVHLKTIFWQNLKTQMNNSGIFAMPVEQIVWAMGVNDESLLCIINLEHMWMFLEI